MTAPLSATTPPEIVEEAISGVVDLLALPGGALLVQERVVVGGPAGEPTVRIRIYDNWPGSACKQGPIPDSWSG